MMRPNTFHWQPAREGDGVVTDLDDILQCVHTVLETPKGSVPLKPWFGSELYKYVDTPINEARPHMVIATIEALKEGEPRVTVKAVKVYLDGETTVIEPVLELANGVVINTIVRPFTTVGT